MTPTLELRQLNSGYNGVPVVRGLDLTVQPGEVVALLGANGAGKTTTLRTASGLLPILGGEVRFEGRTLSRIPAHRLARGGMAYVPEDRGLFRSLTVRDHLKLGRCRVREVLDLFPVLARLLDRRVGLLSGGEQQMLALGRALTCGVRLLLVDEMSLGLAPVIVHALLPTLRQAAEERGIAVLLVEQYVHLALDVADRAYVLSHGSLVLEGSAAELAKDRDLLPSSYMGDSALSE